MASLGYNASIIISYCDVMIWKRLSHLHIFLVIYFLFIFYSYFYIFVGDGGGGGGGGGGIYHRWFSLRNYEQCVSRISFLLAWTTCWTNILSACDLRRFIAHVTPLIVCTLFIHIIFTRGQCWPSGIVVACVCVSVRPPVCQSRACPHDNCGIKLLIQNRRRLGIEK